MLKQNSVQFGTVREDPEIELQLFRKYHVQNAAIIGSGGCTAFSIFSQLPKVNLTLIEPNQTQIQLILMKARVLNECRGTELLSNFAELIEVGNFESLFRSLRAFIFEFIASESAIERLLKTGQAKRWRNLFSHPYWDVAFQLHFSDALLETMFGAAAIQHAPRDSYPVYFRKVIEAGLLRPDSTENYFLFHILLGRYPKNKKTLPIYLQKPPKIESIDFFNGMAQDLKTYRNFDFVGLSNIFDWSSVAEVKALGRKISRELKTGGLVVFRQLNNGKDFTAAFGKDMEWLQSEAKKLHKQDRSLFYSSLHIGRKLK